MKPDAPPAPVAPPPDPAVEAIKAQAETDKLNAIQERTSARSSDLMLRFGARAALAGTPGVSAGGATAQAAPAGGLTVDQMKQYLISTFPFKQV